MMPCDNWNMNPKKIFELSVSKKGIINHTTNGKEKYDRLRIEDNVQREIIGRLVPWGILLLIKGKVSISWARYRARKCGYNWNIASGLKPD